MKPRFLVNIFLVVSFLAGLGSAQALDLTQALSGPSRAQALFAQALSGPSKNFTYRISSTNEQSPTYSQSPITDRLALRDRSYLTLGDRSRLTLRDRSYLALGDTLVAEAFHQPYFNTFHLLLIIAAGAGYVLYRERRLKRKKEELTRMISARSKELEFQQEELRTQIEFTTIQNHKIEKQNLELERHRQHLERLVRQRTADLEAAKKRAEESDRLKSAFLANMSHEIRTPMNAIVGFTNIMIEEQLNEGERKELLEHIHDSSNYLLKLIENIIDISKIESGDLKFKYRPVHLNKLVEDVRDDYLSHQELVRKKLAFNVQQESPNRDVTLRTDVYRVKQILNNLIDNAIKFTYKGEITLGYHLTTLNNHSAVEFFVQDTGVGMTPQQQEHIFDLFRKNSGNQTTLYGGTGIGLTICRKLTLNLGGHIDVESHSGEGSRFSVVIPHVSVKERQEQDSAQSKYSIYRSKSLLLLGSKPGFHSTLKEKLENEEVHFHTAREGQEAVKVFERNREQIDMIIVEAHKSCDEHLETVHKLRKMDESVPIVGITHEFTRHHNEQLKSNTFDEFFHYDVKPHRLLGWICEHSS